MIEVRVGEEAGRIAENKFTARAIRERLLEPAVLAGEEVVLDFEHVDIATQSFIHAMLSRLIRNTDGEAVDLIQFAHCNATVRAVIETVVEYSQDPVELGEDDVNDG